MTTATEIARQGTISEQNLILASVYSSLLDARESLEARDPQSALKDINAAIEEIESWKQKREPEERAA